VGACIIGRQYEIDLNTVVKARFCPHFLDYWIQLKAVSALIGWKSLIFLETLCEVDLFVSHKMHFSGTILQSLNPDDRAVSTLETYSIVKKVHLSNLVQDRGGLDTTIVPESLSHGEEQLLTLGWAILRKRSLNGERCILILHEAKSTLNLYSGTIFHQVIQEKFRNDTIILVAHRLETLKDSDSILVLDKGKTMTNGAPIDVMGQIS
jgi:ABC-type multidrug transport system fused ATPase/permease subunit